MQNTLKEVNRVLSIADYSQTGVFDLPMLRCIHCGRQGLLDTRGERRIVLCSSVLARLQDYFDDLSRDCDQHIDRMVSHFKGSPPRQRTPVKTMFLYGVPLVPFDCSNSESDVVLYLWPKPESLALLYN